MNENIKISGSIGLSILYNEKTNKKVYIFYDDHSNKKYCQDNNFFINNLFEYFYIKKSNVVFLLEEPFVNSTDNLIELWNDSKHLIKFRKFYYKLKNKCKNGYTCKAYPTDIRLSLIDVSIDQIYENLNNPEYFKDYDVNIEYYFRNIFYLFDIDNYYNSNNFNNIESPDGIVIFIKKIFSIFKDTNHYANLKNKVNNFYTNYILGKINTKIYDFAKVNFSHKFTYVEGYPFIDNDNYFMTDELDKIFSGIMEFYIIILTEFLECSLIVINAGYFHCNNIEFLLINQYDYKLLYSTGITNNILKMNPDNITNCLKIKKKYL